MHRSRRQFLTLSALSLSAASHAQTPRAPQGSPSAAPVVIIGAGLAGLRAAEVIRAAGVPLLILEASPRAGGPVRTVRAAFDDGLRGELGALRIAGAHDAVRRSVRAHGLALVPFESAQGAAVSVLGGQRATSADDARRTWALDLKPDEQLLSQRALLERYVGALPADLGDANIPLASYDRWQEYDRLSWPEWLRARGASEDALKVLTLGGESSEVSALYVLRQFALLGTSSQRYKIDGGMDRLPAAMAAGLEERIVYNAAVVRIARVNGAFRIEYERAGRVEQQLASRVVCAIPLTTLRRITREPRWSREKEALIEETAYYPVLRALVQTKTRFWVGDGQNGSARTDRATEIWDAAHDQLGKSRGILGAAVGGTAARLAAGLSADDASAFVVDRIADGYPSVRSQHEHTVIQRWQLDPWARGAFVAGRPGQMTTLLRHAARPEKGVFFAGEHTSSWMGWMERALLPGERAGREVVDAA